MAVGWSFFQPHNALLRMLHDAFYDDGGHDMAGSEQTSNQGMGQAAGDLLKEMQKAQTEMQQLEQKQKASGPSEQFEHVMQTQMGGQSVAQQQQQQGIAPGHGVAPTGRAATVDVLRQAKVDQAPPSTRVGATERGEESKLQTMVNQLVGGQDKMTKIMNLALSGKQFSPTELLAMQAGVYRFSQELDLTSKVVQQATAGIKQTLNTQV
jgi:hypothetical protein